MTPRRVPISFYLNILAGLLVLFHHYAASETGDVALNKITGAIGRFSALFHDTTASFETALCHPDLPAPVLGGLASAVESVLPHDAANYIRVRYCQAPKDERAYPHQQPLRGGGYGSRDSVLAAFPRDYHRQPLTPKPSTPEPSFLVSRRPLPESYHLSHAKEVWERFWQVTVTIGVLALRTYAAWGWFTAPLYVTGAFLAAYTAVQWSPGSSYLGVCSGGLLCFVISQVLLVAIFDFLQCVQWESQRLLFSDAMVVPMVDLTCGIVKYVRSHMKRMVGL